MSDKLATVLEQSTSLEDYYQSYVDYLHKRLRSIDGKQVEQVTEAFLSARKSGKTIYFAGNGGSAPAPEK